MNDSAAVPKEREIHNMLTPAQSPEQTRKIERWWQSLDDVSDEHHIARPVCRYNVKTPSRPTITRLNARHLLPKFTIRQEIETDLGR
jgi:hypothetical protein